MSLEPEGVTLEDRQTGALRFERTFLVLDGDRYRVLSLRVGRGIIRDATASEREGVWQASARRRSREKARLRALSSLGGHASAAKLTQQERSERARKAANARYGKSNG